MEVLGTTYTIGGTLSIPKSRVSSYIKWNVPQNYKAVKTFLSSVSFYRSHLPQIADTMIPLLDLANKGICTKSNKVIPKFEWKHEHNEAFMKIKEMIQNHIVNNIPENDKDFYLETDSSSQAVGCRLTQKDEFGNEIPIASSSRILTKSERSYSIHKKEALSVLYALKSLDIFLNGSRIHLKCDAKSLIFIKCSRGSSEILARFALTLSRYCISVEHVNGKNNVQADAYSRSRSNDSEIDELPQMTESEAAIILDLITLPKNSS